MKEAAAASLKTHERATRPIIRRTIDSGDSSLQGRRGTHAGNEQIFCNNY